MKYLLKLNNVFYLDGQRFYPSFIFNWTFVCVIRNLDDTTRSVYKENVRLSESLNYHMREGEMLKKIKARLEEENETLKGDKELNEAMVQEKVAQVKQQKTQIKQVCSVDLKSQLQTW